MPTKAPGTPVAIQYDGPTLAPGDYLQTRSGRRYLVLAVRVQRKGKHVGRQHVTALVVAPEHKVEQDARVHSLRWHSRGPRR